MVDLLRLERELMRDEGFSARPYQDTMGVTTIGYGRTRHVGGRPVSLSDEAVSEPQAREWLRADIFAAILLCQGLYEEFSDFPEVIQNVLANMAFNLGNKLRKFVKMNEAIKRGDRTAMAFEMRDSLWYGQVKSRARRLVQKVIQ